VGESHDTPDELLRQLRVAVTRALAELDLLFEVVAPRTLGGGKEWSLAFQQPAGQATVGMFVQPFYLFAFSYPLAPDAPMPDFERMLKTNLELPLAKISIDLENHVVVWGQLPTSCITTENVKNLLTFVLKGVDEVRAQPARASAQ
jgi:hypothetical protein